MQLALEEGERLFDFEMFEKTWVNQLAARSWYMVTRLTQVETNRREAQAASASGNTTVAPGPSWAFLCTKNTPVAGGIQAQSSPWTAQLGETSRGRSLFTHSSFLVR